MAVYSFFIFDRHSTPPSPREAQHPEAHTARTAECIYTKSWLPPARPASSSAAAVAASSRRASDDAKLVFGTVFSLRNMVRKLGGDDDAFISYRTGQYKLHFYETPANLRFVLLTDTASASMRNVLHQIYINLWVEYGACWDADGPPCGRVCGEADPWCSCQEPAGSRRAQGRRRRQERAL